MPNPTPDALKSLYFPALNTLDPAEDYDGGIPIRGVENGLQGTVPAWLDMDIGDRVDVFWNNATQEVWSKTIQYESELNRDVIFTLAKDFVLDGDATNVYYKISGKNYPGEESRPRLKLLVKLTRPGGYDDIPGDDGHSDLNFSLDRYEVDQDFPQNGVVTMRIIPYRNLTRYDRIHARWGSQQVMHLVSPEQAADPLKNPIDITFDYDLIKAAGDGSAVAVAFQVVDRCGNYPDERAPWSALQRVLVDMNGDRLDAPLVLVKGQPTDRVDLDTLGDDDVTVRVYTTAKDFAVNDEVLLTWTGTPAQGPQIIIGPLSMPVEFVPFQLDFTIPNEAVRAIAKGSASVGFVRRREGESDRPSKNASVSVVGDISRLPAPSVVEAPGGTLPVDTPWATVSAPWYVGRNGSDLLNVIWEAKAPGGDTVYYEDARQVGNIADGEPVLRAVAQSDIQRFDGLSVKVYYVVTNRDNLLLSVRESLSFIMQVGVAKPIFERPEVEEADANDVLDPDKVPPTGATLVAPFLGTQDKDRVTFYWRGSASGGSTSDYLDMIPATVGKPVKLTIAKTYVTANLNGTVVADYKIERGGETLGHSQELKLRIGVALDLKEPKIKEAPNDSSLDPLNAQNALTAVIDYDGMLVGDKISVRWIGAPGTLPAGSHTTDPWPVTRVGPQEIPLDISVIAFNLDKSITLDYAMTRGTQEPKDSQIRTLAVLQLRVDLSHSPKIIQAAGGGNGTELDVSTLTAAATLRGGFWPHIANGQRVWMRVEGTKKDDKAYTRTVWTGPNNAVNALWISQGYLDASLPLADLQSLKDLSPLNVSFMATPDRSTDENLALSFPVRTYTVKNVVEVSPAITSVKGSPSGNDIPHGSTTVETAITLGGTATPNTKIDLANNDAVMPNTEIQVDSKGEWTFQLTGLVAGTTYKLSARRKDGTPSNTRDVVVVALVVPTLTSVKGSPSGVEIPNAEFTVETAVILTGEAAMGQEVEVFDGKDSKGNRSVDEKGIWTMLLSNLERAEHSITVKALYGTGQTSAPRTFKVVPPLSVDSSLLILDGLMVRSEVCPYPNGVDAMGNTAVRPPSGGIPPYTYESSEIHTASVNSNGKVVGMGNGQATITIRDSTGSQVRYDVSVSKIYDLDVFNGNMNYAEYSSYLAAGAIGLKPEIRAVMQRCYNQPWFKWPWDTVTAWTGSGAGEVYNNTSGSFYTASLTSRHAGFEFFSSPTNS